MRYASLTLTALAMSAALAHALELPNKIHLSREDYLIVQQLYRGWSLLGFVVVGAAVATLTLAITSRNEPHVFGGSLVAFACVASSLVIFGIFTYPVNQTTHNWTILPDNWEALRRQWEYSHAAAAGVDVLAFVALVVTLVRASEVEMRTPGNVAIRKPVHVEMSTTIRARQTVAMNVYRDYQKWPQVFSTIRAVSVVSTQDGTTTLRIDHREGVVINVLTVVSATELRLQEFKKKYDAIFLNRFESVLEGTRYTVVADISLKGGYRFLASFVGWYIRRQIRIFVIEPVKRAAERSPTAAI
jgi:hypothetical protein